MKMTIPTNSEFEKLHDHLTKILFDLVMTGRASSKVEVTAIRWVVEQDKEPYWLISILGMGLDCPMGLDTIAVYLGEKDYDVNNIEIILEANDDSV
jgi:hypothetical protein